MKDYIWKLDVEYPESALHPEGVQFFGGTLKSDWAPRGWTPDDEYIIRFGTERFIWPAVRRFYLSRSSAVDRALLLEHYGCRVRLLRSRAIEFEERNFKRPLRLIRGDAA